VSDIEAEAAPGCHPGTNGVNRMSANAVTGRDEFGPLGNVILTELADTRALVTLTLRNGVALTGLVRKQSPADPSFPPRVVSLVGDHHLGSREVRHDVLMSEVVAITAVAR